MSTSTAIPSLAPTPTAPTPTFINNAVSMPSSADYFFGFLIAFFALLFAFIVCGFATRRRLLLRRRTMMDDMGFWEGFATRPVDQSPPTLWESPLILGDVKWASMKPLSILLHSNELDKSDVKSPQPYCYPSHPPHPPLYHKLLPTYFRRHDVTRFNETSVLEPTVDNIQVAIMIAMPNEKAILKEWQDGVLPEYQIGVTSVQWDKDKPLATVM